MLGPNESRVKWQFYKLGQYLDYKQNNTILTIDDEAYIRKSIKTYFEDYGFTVFEAENGKVGIEIFEEQKPDLVLLDLRMPEMDGLQVLEILKKKSPNTPLIVASGTGNISAVVEALHLGAWDYILKPVQDMNVLFHSVTQCLNESRLRMENREYQERLEELVRERTQELKVSEEKYKATFEFAATAMVILEKDKTISMANTKYAKLVGMDRSEIEGKTLWTQFVLPEDFDKIKTGYSENREPQQKGYTPEQYEFKLVRKNGEIRDAIAFVGRIPGTTKTVSSLLDITEKKKSEKRWRNLEKQLRKSQKMEAIGTLAGGIAHDLNNILSPILGYADMIMRSTDSEDTTSKRSEKIQRAAFRAADLVNQILMISRRDEEEKRAIRIHPVAKEVLKLLKGSIPSTIKIIDRIDTECGHVEADPTQVHQIVMNLCTNAYHAMEDTGGELIVSLKEVTAKKGELKMYPGLSTERYLCLTVEDNGCGIGGEIQDRIFDPYYTTKEEGKGTGLGLSTVYSIVNNYHGEIGFSSIPGKGTCFTVMLPVVARKFAIKEHYTGLNPADHKIQARLLVVDDDRDIADMCKEGFELLGYEVIVFYSSREALAYFKADPKGVDLVVTDQTMPHTTGYNLAKEMLSINPEIPIILCSGHKGAIDLKKATAAGIKRFVMKPYTVAEISNEIQQVLRH